LAPVLLRLLLHSLLKNQAADLMTKQQQKTNTIQTSAEMDESLLIYCNSFDFV